MSRQGKPLAQKEKDEMNLGEFKNFQKDRLLMEDLVALAAFGRAYKAECEAQGVDVPEFVLDNLATLTREIQAKVSEAKAARVRYLKTQLQGLKTAAERRQELMEELSRLEPATV